MLWLQPGVPSGGQLHRGFCESNSFRRSHPGSAEAAAAPNMMSYVNPIINHHTVSCLFDSRL